MKRIALLGSTGSIGTQALDIIERNPEKYSVTALVCGSRTEDLCRQIENFRPEMAAVAKAEDAAIIAERFPGLDVYHGREGLIAAATCDCDIMFNSLMGMRGLEPTYAAVSKGITVALANKETLVAGGDLIMRTAAEKGVKILPVDSEHSAIFQCIQGNEGNPVKRIILTASGGPFRGYSRQQLEKVTLKQALKHPKWNMGKKITIDSATLMNKGLEVIEARWLFDAAPDQIQVVVHPQSIVHSGVEFMDTSVITQMGLPDMRIPISYALEYPGRCINEFDSLDFFSEASQLTFEKPDTETFRCIDLAYRALKEGGTLAAAMNGANEVLVQQFLEEKIGFTDIQDTVEKIMDAHENSFDMSLDNILEADRLAREKTLEILK